MRPPLLDIVRQGRPLHKELVIDAHVHIGPCATYYIPYNTPAEMVEEMERIGIRLAWVFPFMLASDYRMANDDVLRAIRSYPDRFWGLCSINPHFRDEMLGELERCLEGGCIGVKFHPDMHRFDPDTTDLDPVLSYLNRYGLLCHSHYFGSVDTMQRLVRTYPRITFVASHFSVQYAPVVKECDNLFICACTAWGMKSLELFVRSVGSQRVLLGSDFPCLDIATALGPVLFAELTDEEKRQILGINAMMIMDRVNTNYRRWKQERRANGELAGR